MDNEDDLYRSVGRVTRQLHDALRELGYDRRIEDAVGSLPDARDRLSYVSRLIGEAAETVLNGVDRTKAELDTISGGARRTEAALRADPGAAIASGEVMDYLNEVGAATSRAHEQLTEIMLAQDFHDLTGQVIRRVVGIAQALEGQLLSLLVATSGHEAACAPVRPPALPEPSGLEGPVVSTQGRADVVTDQGQVDDLLESLGF